MMDTSRPRGIVVFGGGTATNSLVDVFEDLRRSRNCELSYVIPISDNGGSSSELIRVFGGPGIGDVRSRLVRLIPDSDTDLERASIKELFNYRLTSSPEPARIEWLSIVEGQHPLWSSIGSEKRELIRSIFNLVNMEIVKRARPPYSTFNFTRASIGNLFLTGARVFTGSLESAIYLLSTICAVPGHVSTLPSINSNFTHHISAGLEDGSVITGQNDISHPSAPTAIPDAAGNNGNGNNIPSLLIEDEEDDSDSAEDANPPGSLPTLRNSYINFQKTPDVTPSPAATTATASSSTICTPHPPSSPVPSPFSPPGVGAGAAVPVPPVPSSITSTTCSPSPSTISTISTITQTPATSAAAVSRAGPPSSQPLPTPQEQQQQQQPAEPSALETEKEQEKEVAPPTQPQTQLPHDHLPHPISRIWYINPYGHEIRPRANTKVIRAVERSSAVIYSIGSLYTSLVPSLVLRGVGRALAGLSPPPSSRSASPSGQSPGAAGQTARANGKTVTIGPRHKILILNSSLDRETGGLDAAGFVLAIARAGAESLGDWEAVELLSPTPSPGPTYSSSSSTMASSPSAFSTSSTFSSLEILGGDAGKVGGLLSANGAATPTPTSTNQQEENLETKRSTLVRRFVTHLLYLEDNSTGTTAPQPPKVDRAALAKLGVHAIRVYGRREEGKGEGEKGMLRYDENGLARTLEAVIGSSGAGEGAEMREGRRKKMMGVVGVGQQPGQGQGGLGTGAAAAKDNDNVRAGLLLRGRRSTVSGQ